MASTPGGIIANNPITIGALAEFLVELFLEDPVSGEEVRNCRSQPRSQMVVWMRLREALGRRAGAVAGRRLLPLRKLLSEVTLPFLRGSLCCSI